MGILTEAWNTPSNANGVSWERYQSYLATIRDRLPVSAGEFAEASWHYDWHDHRCPHDAWVEHLLISEPARGSRRERRRIDIEVRLLGAYHDGHLILRYLNVVSYRLDQPNVAADRKFRRWVGHGDWLMDDVGMSNAGFMTHEVILCWGAKWYIECEDFAFEWQPGGHDPETVALEEDTPNRLGQEPATATANTNRATASDILRRYRDEELPEFCDREHVDVNQRGLFGNYPIHVAAVRGSIEEIVALIEGGADLNAIGEHGYTPLHNAAGQGHVEAVVMLLRCGASTTIKNDWGDTPIEAASKRGRHEIADLMLRVRRDDQT